MAAAFEYVELNNGQRMPLIGLGTWQALDEEVAKAVNEALEAGYRMIDTAYVYKNEAVIGKVLKEWFESGRIKREDIFITTKLPFHGMHADKVNHFCDISLKDLGLDYVDLYLIHNPVGAVYVSDEAILPTNPDGTVQLDMTTDLEGIWKEMEGLVKAGKARSIGISNFTGGQVERIVKAGTIKPANLQVELSLNMQQKPLREVCKRHGITVTSYGSLGSPGRVAGLVKGNQPLNLLKHPVVEAIAKAHNKGPGQVLLRHLVQQDIIVIPKSVTAERVKQNMEIWDFALTAEEMKQLNDLDKGAEGRSTDFSLFCKGYENHPENPFGDY